MEFGASGNLHTVSRSSAQNMFQETSPEIGFSYSFGVSTICNPNLDFRPISQGLREDSSRLRMIG
jgi:hypothetical protein